MLIFFFITPKILLSVSECMDYLTNQIILHSLYPDWFHVFIILSLLFISFDDYNPNVVCNKLQENGLLHSSCKEDDSIMMIICKTVHVDLSLVITNWEYHALNNPSDHDSVSDDYCSNYYFPINTSNDNCFTPFDIYGLTSHYSSTCQAIGALLHLLMVMLNPHKILIVILFL